MSKEYEDITVGFELDENILPDETEIDTAEEEMDDVDEIIDVITSDEDELEEDNVSLKDTLLGSDADDLNEVIESVYAIDIAIALEDFGDEDLLKFYNRIDSEHAARILEQMDEDLAQRFLNLLDFKQIMSMFGFMSNDDIADILGEMPIGRRKELLKLLQTKDGLEIQALLSYEDDTAGGIMTTEYIAMPQNMTIREVMRTLKEIGPKTEVIDSIYILDGEKTLLGVADLREVLSRTPDTLMADIMDDNVISVTPDIDQEEVAQLVSKYDLKAIPVINRRGALLGIITVDDIIDVLVEEQNEDILQFGAASGSEDINEPVFTSVKKRLPWLTILLGLSMVVSSVVGIFEGVVVALPIIISFQSLILDMAGNVGTQSLAVTIRALTNENLSSKDKIHLITKEGRVGFTNGLILGILALIGVGIYIYVAKVHDIKFAFAFSACIGAALLVAMLISSIMGTAIPMIFKSFGVDPAVASGPLITTCNDLVAVVTYYGLSWLLLINVMHLSY